MLASFSRNGYDDDDYDDGRGGGGHDDDDDDVHDDDDDDDGNGHGDAHSHDRAGFSCVYSSYCYLLPALRLRPRLLLLLLRRRRCNTSSHNLAGIGMMHVASPDRSLH